MFADHIVEAIYADTDLCRLSVCLLVCLSVCLCVSIFLAAPLPPSLPDLVKNKQRNPSLVCGVEEWRGLGKHS